jgi:hypothetical protein
MHRLAALLLVVGALVGPATARADVPPAAARILGQVPALHGAGLTGGVGPLQYNGGPIMATNATYAIYWIPPGYTVSAGYTNLIDRFLGDVAADSGRTTNVYRSDTQYYQGSGASRTPVQYSSAFAGSVVDSNPLPASGCTDAYTSVCLSDAQLQAEMQRVIAAHGWTGGPTHLFFLFTAKGIGSCAGKDCAFSSYCAYHSWIGSGSSATMYANQPYADTVPSACDAQSHPNGDDADATLNVASHEHNEAITDPQGSAWYDLTGYENGDKCAWDFGTAIGSTSSGAYNQLIGGHPYELQQEWSNASNGCVLTGT